MSKFYTVHDTGQNLLKVIDNETGSQAGNPAYCKRYPGIVRRRNARRYENGHGT